MLNISVSGLKRDLLRSGFEDIEVAHYAIKSAQNVHLLLCKLRFFADFCLILHLPEEF